MAGPTQDIDFNDTQKIAANLIASTLCTGGTEAFLDAQADLLKGVETAMGEWLRRRQEAIAETQRLVARLRESRDVGEIWKAQQEWASGALQRFAADVSAYPALFANAGRRGGEATAQGVAVAAQETRQAAAEVGRRAADVLPRPPGGKLGKAASTELARPPAAPAAEEAHAH